MRINFNNGTNGSTRMLKRKYSKGFNKKVTSMIVSGNTTSYRSGFASGKHIENKYSRITTKTEKGFHIVTRYNKKQKKGAVMVKINGGNLKGVMLILEFSGVSDSSVLDLAMKYDWVAIKKAAS